MSEATVEYRVLARKYRPSGFDELIGQDALVRTLKNAIESIVQKDSHNHPQLVPASASASPSPVASFEKKRKVK